MNEKMGDGWRIFAENVKIRRTKKKQKRKKKEKSKEIWKKNEEEWANDDGYENNVEFVF